MKQNKLYNHRGIKSNAEIIRSACNEAISRCEKYSFRPPAKHVSELLSAEMHQVLHTKYQIFEKEMEISKWKDRFSVMAAPFGAELFLSSDSLVPEIFTEGPEFYMEDIEESKVPNTNRKFHYSKEAQRSSQKIAFAVAKRKALMNYCAGVIQRKFRSYQARKSFRILVAQYHKSAAMIQKKFRYCVFKLRRLRKQRFVFYRAIILVQSLFRRHRIRKMLPTIVNEFKNRVAVRLQKWLKRVLWMFRKKRGQQRREYIHATRVQARFRGNRARKWIWRMRSAEIKIAYAWRRYFRRKYLPVVKRIIRIYRNRILYRLVVRIQRLVRHFLSKSRLERLRLQLISHERSRCTNEQIELGNMIADHFALRSPILPKWIIERTWSSLLHPLDLLSRAIIKGCHISNFSLVVESMPLKKRVAFAILLCFCNRPDYHIDVTALSVVSQFLVCRHSGPTNYSVQNNDPFCMFSIFAILDDWVPNRTLEWKVMIQGHLPDRIVCLAAVTREWTKSFRQQCESFLQQYRATAPPRFACEYCFEPMMWHYQVSAHKPCLRRTALSWINRTALSLASRKLLEIVDSLGTLPEIIRNKKDIPSDPKELKDYIYEIPSDLLNPWEQLISQHFLKK